MRATLERTQVDRKALYEAFASGKTDQELALTLGWSPGTVANHRREWLESTDRNAGQAVQDFEGTVLPSALDPIHTGEKTAGETGWHNNNHGSGSQHCQQGEEPLHAKSLPAASEWAQRVQPGAVYEGVVAVVREAYALVDLTGLLDGQGRCPRGKVSRNQVLRNGWCDDVRGHLRERQPVSVRVLRVRPGGSIDLSIKTAPPRERGLEDEANRFLQPTFAPPGSDRSGSGATGVDAAGPPSAPAAPIPVCANCDKAQVCMIQELLERWLAQRQRPVFGGKLDSIGLEYVAVVSRCEEGLPLAGEHPAQADPTPWCATCAKSTVCVIQDLLDRWLEDQEPPMFGGKLDNIRLDYAVAVAGCDEYQPDPGIAPPKVYK